MDNSIVKPSILPGFMELLPKDQISFNKLMDTIRNVYERFGFIPMDTPLIEKSEILLAKGGGETEKQIYRFNKGNNDISLRFDLTVPLARYVAQNLNNLTFPFRRYQIGKVYRGERNQKGRYREFYQCDIDIIGNGSLSILNDAEIPSIIYSIFKELGFENLSIKVNNRKILNGFFNSLNIKNQTDVLRIIDKVDKIGLAAVNEELVESGLSTETTKKIIEFINIEGSNEEILNSLKNMNINNKYFIEGLSELSTVSKYVNAFGVPNKNFAIDLKICRGLDYYTGTVYETFLTDYPAIGSVCSGGRYDNLAQNYTKQELPGVGISIGLTRLFYQLNEANYFKDSIKNSLTDVLVIPMDDNLLDYSISVAKELRDKGFSAEICLEEMKTSKKLKYANNLGVPFVVLISEEEVTKESVTLKNMVSGTQETVSLSAGCDILKKHLF